jgi:two-component system phosphate regulon sensor histidine kinase PhoR
LIVDKTGRIITVNDSLKQLFSLSRDIVGLTIMEAFRSHDLLALLDRVRQEGVVRDFELSLSEIKETRWVEVNAAAIQEAPGETGAAILIFHDFTRLKQLENVRQEFVANVSHELRTPLTLIKGYVETLLDGAKDDPSVAERFLRIVEKHTARLGLLIEDLLTLAHLESGELTVQPRALPLHEAAEEALDVLKEPAAQKEILLINEVPAETAAYADPERLQQVFFNLIENAIKYSPPRSTVRVAATPGAESVEIHVSDDGPGIPVEAQERIFERFFRLDQARSREAGGTGLGLSIVKHILQRHGGKVWVNSKLGQGSTFCFTLPNEPQAAA